jgi:hypothetical protein
MVIQTHLQALYGEKVEMEFKYWNSAEEASEPDPRIGDKALWGAFISLAVKDLLKKPRKNSKEKTLRTIEQHRDHAVLFFFSRDPYWVKFRRKAFEMAGINPEASLRYLRSKYLEMS